MKAVVATFNQEKALVGAFSVIVQPVVEPMDRFTAKSQGFKLSDLFILFRHCGSTNIFKAVTFETIYL